MHKAQLLPFSRLQFLGAKALMQKAACDGRKIEGLRYGWPDGDGGGILAMLKAQKKYYGQ